MHAAGESSPGFLPDHTFAIVLATRDEAHLLSIADGIKDLGLNIRLVREPDPPWNGQATALGITPIRMPKGTPPKDEPIRKLKALLRRLPLLS